VNRLGGKHYITKLPSVFFSSFIAFAPSELSAGIPRFFHRLPLSGALPLRQQMSEEYRGKLLRHFGTSRSSSEVGGRGTGYQPQEPPHPGHALEREMVLLDIGFG
jgi:hypothetical protein